MIQVTEKRDNTHGRVLWIQERTIRYVNGTPKSGEGWAISRWGNWLYLAYSNMVNSTDGWQEDDSFREEAADIGLDPPSEFASLVMDDDNDYPRLMLADVIMLEQKMWPVFVRTMMGPRGRDVRTVTP